MARSHALFMPISFNSMIIVLFFSKLLFSKYPLLIDHLPIRPLYTLRSVLFTFLFQIGMDQNLHKHFIVYRFEMHEEKTIHKWNKQMKISIVLSCLVSTGYLTTTILLLFLCIQGMWDFSGMKGLIPIKGSAPLLLNLILKDVCNSYLSPLYDIKKFTRMHTNYSTRPPPP